MATSMNRSALNYRDAPEVMAGTRPSANHARREHFEAYYRHLCRDDELDTFKLTNAGVARTTNFALSPVAVDLEHVFPALDAALVHVIVAESATTQEAADILLTLSTSVADQFVKGTSESTTSSPCLDPDCAETFPSLVQIDGWQIVNTTVLDCFPDEALGGTWSDRVKAVADMRVPQVTGNAKAGELRKDSAAGRGRNKKEPCEAETVPVDSEYDLRKEAGDRKQAVERQAKLRSRRSKRCRAHETDMVGM